MSIVVGNLEGFSPLIIRTYGIWFVYSAATSNFREFVVRNFYYFSTFLINCYAISHLLVVVSNTKIEWLLYNV